MRRTNVDTDQIIPAVYLKRVTRTGFEDGLFAAWRADPDFVLNQPQYAGADVLVAGPDFGTGSSREHAVWALQNYGFKAVISPRFADIFRGNSLKGGLLTVLINEADVEALWTAIEADPADADHGRSRRPTRFATQLSSCLSRSTTTRGGGSWRASMTSGSRCVMSTMSTNSSRIGPHGSRERCRQQCDAWVVGRVLAQIFRDTRKFFFAVVVLSARGA